MIAGAVVPNNSPQELAAFIERPNQVKPGTAMPNLGLSTQEAQDVAEFLYALDQQ